MTIPAVYHGSWCMNWSWPTWSSRTWGTGWLSDSESWYLARSKALSRRSSPSICLKLEMDVILFYRIIFVMWRFWGFHGRTITSNFLQRRTFIDPVARNNDVYRFRWTWSDNKNIRIRYMSATTVRIRKGRLEKGHSRMGGFTWIAVWSFALRVCSSRFVRFFSVRSCYYFILPFYTGLDMSLWARGVRGIER